jgi:hypothetical protein
MRVGGFDDHSDPVATFCQQMIPHHRNAVNMAKLLLSHVSSSVIAGAMGDEGLFDILYGECYRVWWRRAGR